MLKLKRLPLLTLAVLFLGLGLASTPAVAASSTTSTQNVVQSYSTDMLVNEGMIVSLKPGSASTVEPLKSSAIANMLGVVIPPSDAPLTLTTNATTNQVYVATSGRYNVYVSNQNGIVHIGDYITISALNGIGMKADASESTVVGRAAAYFNGTNGAVSTAVLKNAHGGTVSVAIANVPVDINVGPNPYMANALPALPFLQAAGNAIANKPVGAARIYISLALLLVTAILAGSLLFSGVRSSLVSIGRNPLARRFIVGGLLQVAITSTIIFIIGLFAVYLLLKL